MSSGWIKMRDLRTHPKVRAMSARLGVKRSEVIGALVCLWHDADSHAESGTLPHLTPEIIDADYEIPGFTAALAHVGWIELIDDGVRLPRYEEHNGETAKRRAENQRHQQRKRAGMTAVSNPSATCQQSVSKSADTLLTRGEEIREYKSHEAQTSEQHEPAGQSAPPPAPEPQASNTGGWGRPLTKRDLQSGVTTSELYAVAVGRGWVSDSEVARMGFEAVAVQSLSKGRDVGRFFTAQVKRAAWRLATKDGGPTEAHYDAASKRLKAIRAGPPVAGPRLASLPEIPP